MTDFVRRLVSGNKARFRDEELDLELDLAYITDRIIVMGFPSIGLEGLYRNRREDAKKFLDHNHGTNYWIFNFCPVKENSYPPEVFEGRVSRYPFPDHHAPPLAILPLVAREMRVWLDGDPERVAVLHCKAGKGRSGTMACAYLLTLTDLPQSPNVARSSAVEEKAIKRAEDIMNVMPADVDASVNATTRSDASSTSSDQLRNEGSDPSSDEKPKQDVVTSSRAPTMSTTSLDHVLKLHTAGRMKPPSPNGKVKPGVSIPSQRRWLYYWSLLISRQGPPGLWSLDAAEREPPPKVRLTQIAVRMHELSGVKANLVKAASALLDRAGRGKLPGSTSQLWASLARYDDELVDTLEWWERTTRPEDGDMGTRRPGSEHQPEGELRDVFATPRWDKGKMVRSFARLGTVGESGVHKLPSEDGRIVVYTLRPLSDDSWTLVKSGLDGDEPSPTVESEQASVQDATRSLEDTSGIVLNANREVRVKLYIGQVFMGWIWFIPTFHMTHPRAVGQQPTIFRLTRKEIDFPLGIGSHIIDVEVTMEWCAADADIISPPARQDSQDSADGRGDPSGIGAAIHAAAIGEAQQAADASRVGDE